jgi:CRISPR system Cascade subunit CasA
VNLLVDPLLRVETDGGLRRLSLPELLAALGRDEVVRLPGIQRHQEDAWHVFLSYLAGAVLARRGDDNPVQGDAYWRSGLRGLADGAGDDAWTLVVPDPSRSAFLQPPLPKADHARLRFVAATPDALDLLPTAKNHDLKQARAVRADPDLWVYALVSLQTMSGYYGNGNPGIARMNGGFGSRAIVELVRSPRPGGRWRDAVARLLVHRREVLAAPYGYDPRGLVPVWVEPWDGVTSLPLSRLDPFYLEICRRVRLEARDGVVTALTVPSPAPRIAAKDLHGVVGDPWLPVDLRGDDAGEKALTVPAQGLTADLLRRLVFADGLRLSVLQRPAGDWRGDAWLTVSVLVRGQGTTDGFHERRVALPPRVHPRVFGPPERRDPFAALGKTAIEYAGRMQYRVLRPGVLTYLGAAGGAADRDAAQAWWRRFAVRFEELWSDAFFPWLWSVPEPFDPDAVLGAWARRLRDFALQVLREAEAALPAHQGRQYRALVMAERRFYQALYGKDNFGFLKEESDERTGA